MERLPTASATPSGVSGREIGLSGDETPKLWNGRLAITGDWRCPIDSLHLHPKADLIPLPDPDTYNEMAEDIAERGIVVPIEVLPDGTVVDGRTRLQIARNFGETEVPARVVDPPDAFAYMVKAARLRRHLTTKQKKAMAALLIVEDPRRSDNSIAADVGLSHPTVAAVRDELEESGDVEEVSTRVDTAGREQPATKPPRDNGRAPDADATWKGLADLMKALETLTDAKRVAATIPDRRRAATAKKLRKLGTYLARIALVIEREEGIS